VLAQGYQLSGQPERAASLFRRSSDIDSAIKEDRNLSLGLGNLADALRPAGTLYESETAACRALNIIQESKERFLEAVSLDSIGLTRAMRGQTHESKVALQRSLRICESESVNQQYEGVVNISLAQQALWMNEFETARSFADRARELAHVAEFERDFICAARVQGAAALGLNDFDTADERLHHALTRARNVNLVEEELPTLIALAELRRRQGEAKAARELLDDVWELAERGPYPLFHADACNVLVQIERDAGNHAAAVEAATKAYRLAWCDGPPFAYHWGLVAAQRHLQELGTPEPRMPPFDASKFEPMPEVEIDPEDEFHVGKKNR
jgi:ATP/maltotriose-dependent transcriptional regulator MalT